MRRLEDMDFDEATQKRLAAKERLTPATGFNVVAVDSYENDPEFELVLVKHCETKEEAEQIAKARNAAGDRAYVYGPTS